ncbi:PLP-dependent aminotransferase family protein [Kitasatospora gansuensis]
MVADLRPGAPDVAAFPAPGWTRSLQHVLATADWERSVFPSAAGAWRLREVVAAYLSRVRGLSVENDEVLITCGTSHGVSLVARVLAARGVPNLAVEDPGWSRLHQVAAAAGLVPEPVAVDAEGLDVEALRQTDARAVLCAPAHQFPTGTALSPTRRRALLAWATERSAVIVEDDYDAEFRYDRRPVGALAGLDRSRVVYLGSVSKTLHPGLRLGWLVPPPDLRQPLLDALDTGAAKPEHPGPAHLRRLRRHRRLRPAPAPRTQGVPSPPRRSRDRAEQPRHHPRLRPGPRHRRRPAPAGPVAPRTPGPRDRRTPRRPRHRHRRPLRLRHPAPTARPGDRLRLSPSRAQWAAEQLAEVLLDELNRTA